MLRGEHVVLMIDCFENKKVTVRTELVEGSLSKGCSWFDKPVLSEAEGLTTNGVLNVACFRNRICMLNGADCSQHGGFPLARVCPWKGRLI